MRWFVLALLIALPAAAQNVVGTGVIDGHEVELLNDGTWREAPDQDGDCRTVQAPISFCGSRTVWKPMVNESNPELDAAYMLDERRQAMLLIEPIGRLDGFNKEALRSTVLEGVAAASGVTASEIPVLETGTLEIDGRKADRLNYRARIKGIFLVLSNSFVIGDTFVVQAITYEVATELTQMHRDMHGTFLQNLRIDPSAE